STAAPLEWYPVPVDLSAATPIAATGRLQPTPAPSRLLPNPASAGLRVLGAPRAHVVDAAPPQPNAPRKNQVPRTSGRSPQHVLRQLRFRQLAHPAVFRFGCDPPRISPGL